MSADNRTGGSYAVVDNVLKQVEAPTVDHPEGNRPRDANGVALDLPTPAPKEQTTGAETAAMPAKRLFGRGTPAPAGGDSA